MQASVFIVGLERQVGLDPDDPIVSFVLFFGTSASLWYAYSFVLHIIRSYFPKHKHTIVFW